jgi:hypothetical protein
MHERPGDEATALLTIAEHLFAVMANHLGVLAGEQSFTEIALQPAVSDVARFCNLHATTKDVVRTANTVGPPSLFTTKPGMPVSRKVSLVRFLPWK